METLFAKLFKPIEKLLIIQYRTWQCGLRLTETLIVSFKQCKKTPSIADTEINASIIKYTVYLTLFSFTRNNLQIT